MADGPADQRARVRRLRPLRDFLHTEAAGGIALLVAAVVALVWANSPWSDSYADLWHTRLAVDLGGHSLDLDLREWINDGLMAIFFFVVGLEIKRELVEGELREPRRAALPAIAAAGGVLTPALIYLAFNAGGDGAAGWGIPVATDIAMAVGVLSLLGSRVDPSLKLFLLALAIVDDIAAIGIIAIFYSDGLDAWAALGAVVVLGAVVACRAAGIWSILVYVALGVALWIAVYESGIHATIAGVALGLLTPTRPLQRADLVDVDELTDLTDVEHARRSAGLARSSVSVVEWLEHVLHPWTSFVIIPLFALANAGVPVSFDALGDAVSSPITHGVVVGLVVGKLVGVTTFTWLAVRLGIGELPPGATWRGIVGVGALAGIGFTVSVFVTGLAFDDAARQDVAKIAILVASTIAAILGTSILQRGYVTPIVHASGQAIAVTYCLAMRLDAGLLFLSDTRTNAGVDNVGTYRKLHVIRPAADRIFVVQSAGSLATTHEVLSRIDRDLSTPGEHESLATVSHLFEAALYLGRLNRAVTAEHFPTVGPGAGATFILGGQIAGERPDIVLVYAEGNYIRVSDTVPFLQIGEAKYGKFLLELGVRAHVDMQSAAKIALGSMLSTAHANLSVGPPYDAAVYRNGSLDVIEVRIEDDNPYLRELNRVWTDQLLDSVRHLPPIPGEVLAEFA